MSSVVRKPGQNIDILIAEIRNLESRIAKGEAVSEETILHHEKIASALKVAKLAKNAKILADQARLTKLSKLAEAIFYEAYEKFAEKKVEQ